MYISLQSTLVAGRVKWPAFAELAHKLGYPGTDVSLHEAMEYGARFLEYAAHLKGLLR